MDARLSPDLPGQSALLRLHDLSGRTAVVTGGASGIGYATAWGFACFGANVAIFDRNGQAAAEAADAVASATSGRVLPFTTEMSDEASVDQAFSSAIKSLGTVDILVNGAGHNIRKPLLDFTQDEFDSLHAVHVRGAFLACRAAGRIMKDRGSGSIINVASVAGHVGLPNVSAYAAAKGALVQLTKAFALEMAPFNVRVNALAPGFIDTPLTQQHSTDTRSRIANTTPLGRFGTPSEVIGAMLFLASDASTYVTGTSLMVDGGWTAQ